MILCILLCISNSHFSRSHHHRTWTFQSIKGMFYFPPWAKISIPALFMPVCSKEEMTVANSSFSLLFFIVKNILAWNRIFCSTANFWSILQPLQIQGSADLMPLVCNILFLFRWSFLQVRVRSKGNEGGKKTNHKTKPWKPKPCFIQSPKETVYDSVQCTDKMHLL